MTNSSAQAIRTYKPLIGSLFIPSFLLGFIIGISQPVLPLYLQYIGASYAIIGTVLSARSFGTLLGTLPASGILSRLSMRTTSILGYGIMAITLLILYLSETTIAIFMSWMAFGIGVTLYEMARLQYMTTYIDNHFRGRAVATVGGVMRMGLMLGPLTGGWVAQQYSFTTPFLVMLGCTLVSGIVCQIYVPDAAQVSSTQSYGREVWETLRQNRRIFTLAGSAQVTMQLVREARFAILPLFAANVLGFDVVTVGTVMSAGAVLDSMMFLPAGYIMDRFGRKATSVPSLTLQALGFLLLPFTFNFWSIVGVSSLIGFANGLGSGAMMTLGADLAPKERPIPFLGVWRLFNAIGLTIGPNVIGGIAQVLALGPASIAVGAIGLVGVSIFVYFVPETLQHRKSEE